MRTGKDRSGSGTLRRVLPAQTQRDPAQPAPDGVLQRCRYVQHFIKYGKVFLDGHSLSHTDFLTSAKPKILAFWQGFPRRALRRRDGPAGRLYKSARLRAVPIMRLACTL